MTAQRCSKCGAFAPAGTAFCAFCGTPLSAIGGAPSATSPGAFPPYPTPPAAPIPWGPAPGWPTAGPAPPAGNPAEERSALTLILLGAILLIVASVAGVVISLGGALGLETVTTSSAGIGIHVTTVFLALAIATSLVELLVILFTWAAFRKLAAFDRRFSTPSKLTLLLAVAVVLIVAVLYPLLTQLSSAVTCLNNASTNNTTAAASCITGTLAGLILIVGIAAILALVGYIGLLIGLWRLGTRYDSGLFKAGAILAIFPLLNLVGAILILVAAHTARERLNSTPPSPVGFH